MIKGNASRLRLRFHKRVWIVWVLGGLISLSLLWFLVSALVVRAELQDIKSDLSAMRDDLSHGDLTAARHHAKDIESKAGTAELFSSGPVWAAVAAVPWVGEPVDSVRGLASTADNLAGHAIPDLLTVADDLDPARLRSSDGAFQLDRIAAANPVVDSAAASVAVEMRKVASLPADTWLGSVNAARISVSDSLTRLKGALGGLATATRIAPTMLGRDGPTRYFVGLMNDAESRGIGGIPGSFAIVVADHGKLAFTHFASDNDLRGVTVDLPFGPAFAQRYRNEQPMQRYIWSDTSPHFPYAAQIWAAMWQKKSGQRIDGAVAVDPTALSYLLAATGSVTAADGTEITDKNVVSLTQSTLYKRFPKNSDQAARKNFLIGVSRAVDTAILGTKNARGLIAGLVRAAGGRRLLVWSSNAVVEGQLATTKVSGIVPADTMPYIGPFVTSGAGNKLDYYLDRRIDVVRKTCEGSTTVVVTARLTNNAPRSGLSAYVTERNDDPTYPVRPGDQNLNMNYFATAGAHLNSASLDGKPASVTVGTELGHPTFQVNVELPAGESRTVVFVLSEPRSNVAPTVLRQPLVRPLALSSRSIPCR